MDKEFKLVAPDVDRLINCFERGHLNAKHVTKDIAQAMEPIFKTLKDLAPLKSNDEVKSIWVRIPRGDISDYDSFQSMKEYGEVETYDEYLEMWNYYYPDEEKWYELIIMENFESDGSLRFRGVMIGHNTIISAMMDKEGPFDHTDPYAISLCGLINDAAQKSMDLLLAGKYNDMVDKKLPYWFRRGVIRRSDVWEKDPEQKKYDRSELSEIMIENFCNMQRAGKNNSNVIGRIKTFTANDFFKACAIGYKACGYDIGDKTPSELYLRYADGRDEGLTGTGHGLNEGPGIDFDDPKAWDEWYFDRHRGGGHPWEVVPGGNSTHLGLFVCHDENENGYMYRAGKISEDEYRKRQKNAGYYFKLRGKHRPFEAVSFYLALSKAGIPVILEDGDEIMARFKGTDFLGIVPHDVITRYCESMFPKEYGRVIDFIHVYEEELEMYGDDIIWIPEEHAEIVL